MRRERVGRVGEKKESERRESERECDGGSATEGVRRRERDGKEREAKD